MSSLQAWDQVENPHCRFDLLCLLQVGGQLRGPRLWRKPGTQLSASLPPGICASPLPALFPPRAQSRSPREALLFPVLGRASLAPLPLSPRTQAKMGCPWKGQRPCSRRRSPGPSPGAWSCPGHHEASLNHNKVRTHLKKSTPSKPALQPWGAQTH